MGKILRFRLFLPIRAYIIFLHVRLGQKEDTSFSHLLPGFVAGEMGRELLSARRT